MRKAQLVVSALLLVLLLAACAPQAAPRPAPQSPAPQVPAPAAPAKEAWQVEWNKTLEAAKKEGTLVLGTPGGAAWRNSVTEGFKRTYGITVEAVSMRAAEFYPRIFAERRAGVYAWDSWTGAGVAGVTKLKPAGTLDRLDPLLVLPDLTDPELIKQIWYGGRLFGIFLRQ